MTEIQFFFVVFLLIWIAINLEFIERHLRRK